MERESKTPKISEDVADRYLFVRQFLRKNTADMANEAGVSVTVISGIENAKVSKINTYYTAYLVEKKGINPDYLNCKSSEMLAQKQPNLEKEVEILRTEMLELKKKNEEKDSVINYLMGELERLKKELSQSRTIPMTDHGYHQLPEVQVGKHKTVNNDWGLWRNGNLLKKAI